MQNFTSRTQTSFEGWFQPMGFKLYITSNSRAVIEAAEVSFGGFGPTHPTDRPDFTFRFFEHHQNDGPPGKPTFRMEGHLLYQTTGCDSTLVADLATGFAFGYFSTTTLAHQAFFRWHFLELALFLMLESKGLMGVHGAALVKNGKAILLRAPSGGGKTTLAYAGARRRFKALAEDVVWLDRQRGLWWGIPWFFHLLPDAKKLFPELGSYSPLLQTSGEMKLEVNLEQIRAGSTTVSALPGVVILIERLVGGNSRLESLDPVAAMEMWEAGRTGLEMKLPHHKPQLDLLLSRKIYRLYFGDDIEESLDLLEPLFE